jgi:lipopolysaccharide cholinephosphotransferase
MRRLREIHLDLLRAFDEFCRRHRLPYFAIAGTALGAIRHQGFIPWDDDVDLAMPRAAFDAFVRTAPTEFDERYFVQHHSTDPQFPLPMSKLRRNDSVFAEEAVITASMHQGIFIDIFPIDRKPKSPWGQRAHYGALTVLSRIARLKSGYDLRPMGRGARLLVAVARRLLRAVPMRSVTQTHESMLRAFRDGRGPLTIAGGTYGYLREWFDPRWLAQSRMSQFEGQLVPVFAEVEAYLTHLYGDYMTLPPETQRTSPHVLANLEFPDD